MYFLWPGNCPNLPNSLPDLLLYSLAQVMSTHGLTKEESGRDGHSDEFSMAESPVFSIFLQMAFRVWVPSPQLTEHWEQNNSCLGIIKC